jgi:hypothetical protein
VAEDYRFDEPIEISLRRDETIVLAAWLGREVHNEPEKVRASFVHPAEEHSLLALLHRLWGKSDDIDQIAGIVILAREHLLKRYT